MAIAGIAHDSATELLRITRRSAAEQKARGRLDQHVANQHELSAVYTRWMQIVHEQQRTVVNHLLRAIAIILIIALIGVLVDHYGKLALVIAKRLKLFRIEEAGMRIECPCHARDRTLVDGLVRADLVGEVILNDAQHLSKGFKALIYIGIRRYGACGGGSSDAGTKHPAGDSE